jgi:hypothetical protein
MNGSHILVLAAMTLQAQDPATEAVKKQIDRELMAMKLDMAAAKMSLMGVVVAGAPYSALAVTESQQTLGDGTHIRTRSTYRIHRDSAGRVAREEPARGSGVYQIVSIFDPVAGVTYTIDWAKQAAQEIPLKIGMRSERLTQAEREVQGYERTLVQLRQQYKDSYPTVQTTLGLLEAARRKRDDILKEENAAKTIEMFGGKKPGGDSVAAVYFMDNGRRIETLAPQIIEGLKVEGTRSTSAIAAGAIGNDRPIESVFERWYSPDLRVEVLTRRHDPRVGDVTVRLTEVQQSEPAAYLFQVPPGIRILPARVE